MGRITILSGVGGSGSVQPSPNRVTLGTPLVRLGSPDRNGKTEVEIFIPYTPPSPLGSFAGVIPYLQAPDNIPASAAGNAATIGDQGFIIAADIAHASDAGSIVSVSQPVPKAEVPYDPSNLIIKITAPMPASAETWRLYALSDSPDVSPTLVTADKPSPTPNVTFLVDPAALAKAFGASGAEYAPLAASFTSPSGASVLTPGDGLTYLMDQVGGGQFYTINGIWTNAVNDPRFSQLGGYDLIIRWPDGSDHLHASFSATAPPQFLSSPPWVVPSAPQTFTAFFVSWQNANPGNINTIIPGLTPSVTFTVGPQVGTAGQEYAGLVTGLSVSTPGFTINADGQRDYPVIASFTDPDDPNFAGVVFHFLYPDGTDIQLTGLVPTSPNQLDITYFPTAALTVILYPLSVGLDGNTNTYVPGVTPSIPVTLIPPPVGSAGMEYAPLVTGFTASVIYEVSGDGVEVWSYKANWTNPSSTAHPEYGGPKFVLRNTSGTQPDVVLYAGRADTSFQSPKWPVGAAATYKLFEGSIDVNQHENTIVDGVTPEVTFSVSLQTTGSVKGNRLDPTTLAPELVINSGLLGVATNSLALTKLATSIRPVVIVASLPTLPDTQYPAGTIIYNTASASLYKVNAAGTAWGAAVNSGDIVANSIVTGLIAAAAVNTPQLAAGAVTTQILTTSEISIGSNGASMPIRFRVYDHVGSPIAWIGDDTANSGYVGGWFKQLYAGGSGPAGAPFKSDAGGNVTINGATFTLNLNGVTTSITNTYDTPIADYVGLKIQNNTSLISANVTAAQISFKSSSGTTLAALLTPGNTSGELLLTSSATPGDVLTAQHSGVPGYTLTLAAAGGNSSVLNTVSLSIGGTQVVITRQTGPGIPSFATLADVAAWCGNLNVALKAHGLIT